MDRRKALRTTGILAGATIAVPSMIVLLESCKSESIEDWKKQFFTNDEARCISSLVNTILPRTETPGALDVNVDVFLDRFFALSYDEERQSKMRVDIEAFNVRSAKGFGEVFANLSSEDRIRMLNEEEQLSGKFAKGVWGKAVGNQEPIGFYRSIKSMAIWAYCTSEKIGKEVLNYDPIPGEYLGCIPLSEVGNKWSL